VETKENGKLQQEWNGTNSTTKFQEHKVVWSQKAKSWNASNVVEEETTL